jgi:hypothetical protein
VELYEYQLKETTYGGHSETCLCVSNKRIDHWNRCWQSRCSDEIERRREKCNLHEYELKMEFARARNAGTSTEELETISRKISDCWAKTEEDIPRISKSWDKMES